MSGKYGDLIQKARKSENQKDGLPESQNAEAPTVEPDVNMTIKVPKRYRQHWVSQAKAEGSTLTAVIIESLTQKYGLPE